MSQVQPQLSVLTPAQIQQVHAQTLELLARTGIRVDSQRARGIFSQTAGTRIEGHQVRFSAELVEQALASAPSRIEIFDRKGEPAFCLDSETGQNTIFGIGVTNNWYQEPETGEVLPFSREHNLLATRLGNTLESFDVISTPGIVQNSEDPDEEVNSLLVMLANTHKPLIPLISHPAQFEKGLELLKCLLGDLSLKPAIIPYFNPITPLVLNEDTSDKMIACIQAGLPLIYSSYGMSGATAPITASGTLVMLNAELLAGLVFAQLVKRGTPVILGSLPALFNMQYVISAYTSQTMLVNLACAELMAHYAIPHCGTSGSGAGWGPDLLASGGLWMNHLSSCLGKVGLAPFVGGNFDSLVFSPETVIYANEVIRQVRLFAGGFDLDGSAEDLDTIHAVGPGGSFFTTQQTLDLYQQIHEQHNRIWPGYSLDKWRTEHSPSAHSLLRTHVRAIMADLKVPADHHEILAWGEAWLQAKSS